MQTAHYHLKWDGPFQWYGSGESALFSRPEAQKAGIYLWSVHAQEHHFTYYVGETGRPFATRFAEHTRNYLGGYYQTYEPDQFAQGIKVVNWEGIYGASPIDQMSRFLEQYHVLAPKIYRMLGIFQIYLAPFDIDQRIRQRIESAIAQQIYQQPAPVGTFLDEEIRYSLRRGDEDPIAVTMEFTDNVPGFRSSIVA